MLCIIALITNDGFSSRDIMCVCVCVRACVCVCVVLRVTQYMARVTVKRYIYIFIIHVACYV